MAKTPAAAAAASAPKTPKKAAADAGVPKKQKPAAAGKKAAAPATATPAAGGVPLPKEGIILIAMTPKQNIAYARWIEAKDQAEKDRRAQKAAEKKAAKASTLVAPAEEAAPEMDED